MTGPRVRSSKFKREIFLHTNSSKALNTIHIYKRQISLVLRHFQQYFSYFVGVSFIGGGNQSTLRKPLTCRKSLTNFIMLYLIHLTWVGFKLTTLVVIGTDCIGSHQSNYHAITTMMASSLRILVYIYNQGGIGGNVVDVLFFCTQSKYCFTDIG